MRSPLLYVNNIIKSFWNDGVEIPVLRGANFKIDEGEVVTVMGPSGVGKSTLLNLVGTLDIPDSGDILYDGINPFTLPEKALAKFRNSHIGFVFQFHHLLPEFTALENVMIPSIIRNNNPREAEQNAIEILERVGLKNRANHRPSTLSGGERQRVAIARALINKPVVVLADEPTGNLDVKNGEVLVDLILELSELYNRTFIIATHNPSIAEKSGRILTLSEGHIEQ